MKMRLVVALVGLAISFALPTFAQQTNADPQLRQALDDLFKRETEAYNNNDAAAIAGSFTEDAIFVTPLGPFYGREKGIRPMPQGLPRPQPTPAHPTKDK